MSKLFSIKPTLTIRGRKFNGIRGWAGKPTHPPLTDFPIVCYVLAAVFDIVSYIAGRGSSPSVVAHDFNRAALFVIAAGAIVSLGTALTGFFGIGGRVCPGTPRRGSSAGQSTRRCGGPPTGT